MKIFLSYSSSDKNIAEQVNFALIGYGCEVFFDQTSLFASSEYNSKIRQEVFESNLFIFMISPDSVTKSSYALTELGFAQEKWPHPKNHVLPVLIKETNFDAIPNYLKAVTILEPKGNPAAEISSWVIKNLNIKEKFCLWLKRKKFFALPKVLAVVLVMVIINFSIHYIDVSNILRIKPVDTSDSIKFEPIPYIDNRLKMFIVSLIPPVITVRFISEKWHIDHVFRVSKAIKVEELKEALLTQLSLREHVKHSSNEIIWVLKANGKELNSNGTLQSENVTDHALLELKIKLTFYHGAF
jgi:TIR domain